MKQKLLFFFTVVGLIEILNALCFLIAKFGGLGNNYSLASYLYMPLLGLSVLVLLLLLFNIKVASIIYVTLNMSVILYLLLKNSLESHDFFNDVFLEDSRFCYLIIGFLRRSFITEFDRFQALMYMAVFSIYYVMIFVSAKLLVKRWRYSMNVE